MQQGAPAEGTGSGPEAAARLGPDRAAALAEELASQGLVIVDADRLARLEAVAASYERLRALASEPDASA